MITAKTASSIRPIRQLFCDTGMSWKLGILHQRRSMSGAAVRRLAYEASDNGLLNPDLAAGIRRVKGAKRLGLRLGNWLTVEQGKKLLAVPSSDSLRDKRDYAILAIS